MFYHTKNIMKCLFVINPVSGTQAFHKNLNEFLGKLILNTEVNLIDTYFTKGNNDAFDRCFSLEKGEYDFVVSVGGDGTVNECMGGIIKSNSEIPIAIIPAGTVNDFASYLNLPLESDDFIDMINNFHTEKIDVGIVENKVFANVVAGGMFSDIAFEVSSKDKNRFGSLAYYLTGIARLPEQLSMDLNLDIEVDGEKFSENACLFLVTNTSYVGGFKDITPKATVQDGKLDLLIIKKTHLGNLLTLLKDFTFSDITNNSIIRYRQAENIKIDCDKSIKYDVDGEEGEHFPLEISCMPGAINLLMNEKINSQE